jgi:hypothetical protein
MQKPASLIVNGLGALLGLFVVGYIISAAFYKQEAESCRSRYPAPMLFALRGEDGAELTPIELQARTGLSEWGMLNNAKVVDEGPGGAALQISLAPVPDREANSSQRANGVGFAWLPARGANANAACLSYSVWLPEDFDFASGGLLPGIVGGGPQAQIGPNMAAGELGTRAGWSAEGSGGLSVEGLNSGYRSVGRSGFTLARGRWIAIEQELVLNAPGKTDGLARLWVDGKLKGEGTRLELRKTGEATIAGVLADVGYLGKPKKPGMLRLSAFELAWR